MQADEAWAPDEMVMRSLALEDVRDAIGELPPHVRQLEKQALEQLRGSRKLMESKENAA